MLKNITLSANTELIHQARNKAQQQHTTLNAIFRQWLQHFVADTRRVDYKVLMQHLSYVHSGKSFSRDELNERSV